MIICHVCFSFAIGGIENMAVDVLNEQVKKADIYLIVVNNEYNSQLLERISKQVKIILINRPKGNRWNFIYIIKLWILLLKINPTVIHCHTPKLIVLLFPFKSRCIYTVHSIGIPVRHLHKYKKLFSISKAVKMDLLTRGNLESEINYNGINFLEIRKKKNYNLKATQDLKIIQIGRLLHEQKGQDILIRSLYIIINNYGIKNISLMLIGEGPSKKHLENLTSELNLQKHITFAGSKERSWIYRNLIEYHILIQPSRLEGFGLTLIEAIAAGLPVIASRIDGPAEILHGISSAFMFETENIEELSLRIKEVLMEYYDQQIEGKCKKSSIEAISKFSVIATANNYLKFYSELC